MGIVTALSDLRYTGGINGDRKLYLPQMSIFAMVFGRILNAP